MISPISKETAEKEKSSQIVYSQGGNFLVLAALPLLAPPPPPAPSTSADLHVSNPQRRRPADHRNQIGLFSPFAFAEPSLKSFNICTVWGPYFCHLMLLGGWNLTSEEISVNILTAPGTLVSYGFAPKWTLLAMRKSRFCPRSGPIDRKIHIWLWFKGK